MLMGAMRPKMVEKDWVKFVLNAKVVHEPGTVFQYNNAGPYLLGILVQRKTGMSLVDYLMPRLFEPLGIARPECEKDPLGNTFGAGGLQLNVSEFAKLGLLYLQKGQWNGRQLIPEQWVAEAGSAQILSDQGDDEIGRHYGYLFWTMPDGAFRADGKYGQYCIVLPKKNAVVAINSMQIEDEKKCSAPLSEPCFLCYNKGRQTPERMEHPWNTERWNMSLSLHRRKTSPKRPNGCSSLNLR